MPPATSNPPIRLSQIYGGGGQPGAPFSHDFIELFNAGPVPASLDGWTVRYAPASGAAWQGVPLDSLSIAPFSYLLVLGASSGAEGAEISNPDKVGGIQMSANAGKVALVDNAGVRVDFVGYGHADEAEGVAVSALSNTSAAQRKDGGCVDTQHNQNDFEITAPAPRHGSSGSYPCPTPIETPIPTDTPSPTTTITPLPPVIPPETSTNTATPATLALQLMINEIDADAFGSHYGEFIELYDGGIGHTALDGLVLVFFDGADDQSYRAYDLDGYQTDASGYFVAGNRSAVGSRDVPGIIFPEEALQNGADAVALYLGNGADFPDGSPVTSFNLMDAIVYGTDNSDDSGLLAVLGSPQVNENAGNNKGGHSNQRCPNGSGPRNATTFVQDSPSPGAPNLCASLTATSTWTPSATPLPTPSPSPHATSSPTPFQHLIINEIDADTPGADNAEFVELYDGGIGGISLNGLVLVFFNGASEQAYFAFDLDGFVTDAEGYFVIGNPGVARLSAVFGPNTLQNGPDAVALFAGDPGQFLPGTPVTTNNLIDALVYHSSDPVSSGLLALLEPGQLQIDENGLGNAAYVSLQRCPSGSGAPRTTGAYLLGAPSPGATNTCLLTPTPTPTFTPPATPPGNTPPRIVISEFLADPKAVSDAAGEWLELHNRSTETVNLRNWILADLDHDQHTISTDLVLAPGAFAVLARNNDPATNGGVMAHYMYTSFQLANEADEILLIAPTGEEVDRVVWGSATTLAVTSGASLERVGDAIPQVWATAVAPWSGSAGDYGSPGMPYTPPIGVTPTPTPTTFTSLPHILISEFLADPGAVADIAGEWVELYNAGPEPVNLRGWILADHGTDQHIIQTDLIISPGVYMILARNGDFTANGGVLVNYVYTGFTLANDADEILLLAPDGATVDQVVWGGATPLAIKTGASFERDLAGETPYWTLAYRQWPTSAGDLGSPGSAYAPPPATATPMPTTTTSPVLPRILISEFLADPSAVDDADGEWFELHNPTGETFNLRGWALADLGDDHHIINTDLMIGPGEYVVLARNGDSTTNGGAPVHYVYSGFVLANDHDAIILYTPDGRSADQIYWGGDSVLAPRAGASLERTTFDETGVWKLASTPWPGSAGDAGSPGTAYMPSPVLPSPTPGDTIGKWHLSTAPGPLVIDEVIFYGADEEGIALINTSESILDLAGWVLGDAQIPGASEGMYDLPPGYLLAPGELFVIARNGASFRQRWGRSAHAEIEDSDPLLHNLARRGDLARGSFALNDSGDEVVLLNPAGQLADGVAFRNGDYAALYLTGLLNPPPDYSLQRAPLMHFSTVADIRHRFLFAPPRPFEPRGLPLPQAHDTPRLSDGYLAIWGSLGAQSSFTPGYTAPPHYLAAAAGAAGLDFIAVADATTGVPWTQQQAVWLLPAWRWQNGDERAILYTERPALLSSRREFLDLLATQQILAQWQSNDPPLAPHVTMVDASQVEAPGRLSPLVALWMKTGVPLLPAGNSNPPLPGALATRPRYTGLAVAAANQEAVLAALATHRGWLTSAPGLWLTLQATSNSQGTVWMGSTITAENELAIHIHYGDHSGDLAGLALWQNNQPLRQLDLPPADGHWSFTMPAAPDSFLYAVATQADGDFAVTAPVRVAAGGDGKVLINEVLPAPASDLNQDGRVDGEDEFIELYNPGSQPVGLAGWKLVDKPGEGATAQGFTFGADRVILGGQRLLIWRKESRINLNVRDDYVRLLNPAGEEVDRIGWEDSPDHGRSLSRIADGQAWRHGALATPGQPNRPVVDSPPRRKQEPAVSQPDIPSTAGQADGPLGSIAHAKLAGLYAWVEFQGVVTVPPGLFNQTIYLADPAPDYTSGPLAGIGIHVYLRSGEFPPLQEGDRVRVRGRFHSFRGEMELQLDSPDQLWRLAPGALLQPLPVTVAQVGESLEGRLVTLRGVVSGWQGDSFFLQDLDDPQAPPLRVAVLRSLGWQRPFVQAGEVYQVTGIVSQLASQAPWNGGYRLLVRHKTDLVKQPPTLDN